MSRDCGFEPSALAELLAKREAPLAEANQPQTSRRPPDSIWFTELNQEAYPTSAVWVCAGPIPFGESSSRPALLLRDALAQLGRVLFDRREPVPVITTWQPSMTPQLLEGAARFGGGTEPLVWVFMTDADKRTDQIVQLADWRRGKILGGASASDLYMDMLHVGCRCAIILGGGREQQDEVAALLNQHSRGGPLSFPLFAVASTGGIAADELRQHKDDFGGSVPDLELEHPTSYLVLMQRILKHTAPKPKGSTAQRSDAAI
jgi:hypothetical protein